MNELSNLLQYVGLFWKELCQNLCESINIVFKVIHFFDNQAERGS